MNTYPTARLDKQNNLLMVGRSQLSLCYKKLIIPTTGDAMFSFTKKSSGYIQIRNLATHVQNSISIAINTDTSNSQISINQAYSSKTSLYKNHYHKCLSCFKHQNVKIPPLNLSRCSPHTPYMLIQRLYTLEGLIHWSKCSISGGYNWVLINKAIASFMDVSVTLVPYETANVAHMSDNTYFITSAILSTCSYQI